MASINSGTTRTCPVAADAQWELVCDVPESKLIEGVNMRGGVLWFMDVIGSSIMKVENGRGVVTLQDPERRMQPNGGRFVDDTTMLVSDRGLGLCAYDTRTNEYRVAADSFEGTSFLGLSDMVLDGKGGVYVTDAGGSNYLQRDGAVYHINYGDGSYEVTKVAEGFAWPNGVAISPDGAYLYVAEFHTNSIVKVPALGTAYEWPHMFCRLEGGHGPDGMTSDANGNVYAAHLGAHEVAIVNDAGWLIGQVALPAKTSDNLSNVLIDDGWLYVCECGNGSIWRIPIDAEPNPLAG